MPCRWCRTEVVHTRWNRCSRRWSRTGTADGVASVQIALQLFYNYFTS